MIKLRDYQQKIIADVKAFMQAGQKNILIQLPTGGGKSAIGAEMIRAGTAKGTKCWFVVNRVELVEQTCKALYTAGVPFGVVSAGYSPDRKALAQVCSIQTLTRRLDSVDKPGLIFWDETRGIAARTWSNVYHNNPQAYHIGLDATPERASGEPLNKYYQVMVQGPSVRELMDMGFLCDYRIIAAPTADFKDVRVKMGDYVVSDLDALMNTKKIVGDAVKEYKKYAMGKRNLVFCNSIKHSEHMCQQYNDAGIRAEHIDGKTDKGERAAALKRFERGETLVLTSVDLVTAGLDIPAIQCVTLERATKSIALAKQMIGRGLRPSAGKDKLIIFDHVNAWKDHGLPDADYPWSLEGRTKENKPKILAAKLCAKCYAAFKPFLMVCPECGNAVMTKTREQDFEGTDEEMVELDLQAVKRKLLTEQGQCKTKEELTELGYNRGYKNPHRWAHYIMQGRQQKKNRGFSSVSESRLLDEVNKLLKKEIK